ncbi:bifunctional 3,4-dihydroxy-2-butanone-4-phosphate synthase/GTP cyclohydrolase II [Occultella gossypii]|uniref:Multifunctional fusion protein n=1 Tax=Occultella gossypii TaxID=2800820 RepID=A0ABS7SGJ3_9MICO|nr:bifunctional 3,4-dihydroxy-2-butanone-4-phosphate synthase/GTP cyclohydrolase II [Occultella gossypii]MBZ2199033.1 bifunctional 3,4-dihydroxy-2-butanone-4-phosphate synthase/GTP cyclohydrolase II [Occultella gossypii]
MNALRLDPVSRAVAEIAAGRPVVVVDDAERENEGDLIFSAAAATPELLAMTVRYSSGIICAPMPAAHADRLGLPLMVERTEDPLHTAFTVSVDARDGVSTGISAADRASTLRLLAGGDTTAGDLTRPGHVFPLRARAGGVLERRGHTEAAVDLMALAGLPDVGVLVELVHDDGTMMRGPALREFADHHGLAMISIEDLAAHRRATITRLEITEPVRLPTSHGVFTALAVREADPVGGTDPGSRAEHLVLVRGDVSGPEPVLVRVHSECVTGDVLGSRRCDCGPQLQESLARIDREGRGVLVLLRGHEGRGIGLIEKLRAYALQETGRDTVDANLDLGLPVDARSFAVVPRILDHLDVRSVRLLTHNPAKAQALRAGGVDVTGTVDLTTHPTPENLAYLTTKRDRLGHHLVDLPHQTGESA